MAHIFVAVVPCVVMCLILLAAVFWMAAIVTYLPACADWVIFLNAMFNIAACARIYWATGILTLKSYV